MENSIKNQGYNLSLKKLLTKVLWTTSPLKLLTISIEHDLWDYMNEHGGKVALSDIETAFSWKKRPFTQLVNIFEDLGLLVQNASEIQLTPISRKWLVKSSKDYIGDFVLRANVLAKAYDTHLETLLKDDVPDDTMDELTKAAFGGEAEASEVFAKSMDAMTREFAEEILKQIETSQIRNCLDVGAGMGMMANIISERQPTANFTVLELPGVAELLEERVNHFKYHQHFRVISANWRDIYNHIAPDTKFDLIILSQVLHEEKGKDAEELIKICADLLSPNGRLAIIGFLDDSSLLTHLFSLNMLMELGSDNLTLKDISPIAEKYGVVCHSTYVSQTSGRMLWLGQKN